MEGSTQRATTSHSSTATTSEPRRGSLTNDQRDKVVALQQLMRGHFDPLPPQLLHSMRILPRHDKGPIERDPEWLYCTCFLVSREWDVQKAFAMMQTVVAYRADNGLDERSQLPPAVSVRGWDNAAAVCASLGKAPRHAPDRVDRLATDVAQTLSCGLHYWDKGGRPVVYVMVDSLDEAGLIRTLKKHAAIGQTPADVMWMYGQHFIGVGEDLVLYQLQQQQQRLSGKETRDDASHPVTSPSSSSPHTSGGAQGLITLVMDLKGFHVGLLWKPMLDLFRDVARKLFQYYPDMVHRILAVNAPGLVRVAFNMVKGVMTADFQKKISFVGPQHTMEALEEEIDLAYIPAFLGGRCRCRRRRSEKAQDGNGEEDGGGCCIDGYDRADPLRRNSKAKHGKDETSTAVAGNSDSLHNEGSGEASAATDDIALSGGQRHRRVFHLRPSETVVWEFAVPHNGGADVVFSSYFVPHADTAADAAAVNWSKLSTEKLQPHQIQEGGDGAKQAGAFTASERGTLVLSWHNTRLWFKTRHVQLRVYKDASPQSNVPEEKGDEEKEVGETRKVAAS
ncbi:hypothetical protein ABB37_05870 [Leptomonas pyrrhocoris]|uniref:CRAL-TRIO domain-containing protein n=1 Tax=Leptomonas pyrrhocoris TaxID=157538 RepID=A0A0M9FYT6_LEPPY|nr:hypothetical protein ABB37_05870 [Leptomonas pyrrhocoris]KPA78753.1 hypothetical protein ABB37_05870 [Leptomonas pyrrhocoris]|eukprot:XP_015657192.1 hypothetical protein ABB37_05870 [Leptomonas pyrrhocoris]